MSTNRKRDRELERKIRAQRKQARKLEKRRLKEAEKMIEAGKHKAAGIGID